MKASKKLLELNVIAADTRVCMGCCWILNVVPAGFSHIQSSIIKCYKSLARHHKLEINFFT